MKKWRKENWFLVAAIAIFIVGSLLLSLRPNPNEDSARYLLSTIPQVIGTVFVLTVAIMQAVGGSELMDIGKLVSKCEFKVAAGVSFLGIVCPLVVLYLDQFCIGTALCLSFSAGNLFVIGWFVWRIAPQQAAAKSLSLLKKEALEKLAFAMPSEVTPILKQMAEIGELTSKNITAQPQTNRDACTAIRDITLDDKNKFPEVWKQGTESLISIDTSARERKNYDFSETVTLPYLHEVAAKSKFEENLGWLEIKEHLFKCFHEDIEKGRVDFDKWYEKNKRTALQSLRIFLSGARNNKEKWDELGDPLINELVESLKKGYLKEEHLCPIVGLIFNIIVEGALVVRKVFDKTTPLLEERVEEYYENLISQLTEISNAVEEDIKKLLGNKKECVANRRYSIIKHAQRAIEEKFDELMKRLKKS